MHFYASTHALRPEQARLRTTNAESHYFFLAQVGRTGAAVDARCLFFFFF